MLKWNAWILISAALIVKLSGSVAASQEDDIKITNEDDSSTAEFPIRKARHERGRGYVGPTGGLGLLNVNLFEKVAMDTANVFNSVNQQIGATFNQLSRPYAPGQPLGFSVGFGVNGGLPNYYGQPQLPYGRPGQSTYGYPQNPYGAPPPYGRPPPHGGHEHYHEHHHGHGHGHSHGHSHGQGSGYGNGYGHGGHDGNVNQGANNGQFPLLPEQNTGQWPMMPPRIPVPNDPGTLPPKSPGSPNGVITAGPVPSSTPVPIPPAPPAPAPAPPPPTVLVQPQPSIPAPPPPSPPPAPTAPPAPSSTTEDIEDVTYDIDIRSGFETDKTRRRRQLIPSLFNSIGNIVQTGVNLANPSTYQQAGQSGLFPIFGFGQRPTSGQQFYPPPQQSQPVQTNQLPPQSSTTRVPFRPAFPPTNSRPVAPPTQAPTPAAKNPNPATEFPELNLQNLGGTDFTWTAENIGAQRVRRDTDSFFFPDDEIFNRPLPVRPVSPALKPVIKQPFSQESQAGSQSQAQNIFGGFEQSSGSQSQSQTIQNGSNLLNQNAAGSTSGNIATDGSSGQLSAANTMQQSFQTADSSGSKNAAQSQSANFDKNGNLALTSSNANTNSVREKDRFKEQSNAGSSSTLQNQFGTASNNAQSNSETFFENGLQGNKNTASSQSLQTNKDGSVSGSNSNTISNTFTGPNGQQGSSSSSQSSSFNQGAPGAGGASATSSTSSSAGNGGAFSISGSFSGFPPFQAFPNLFNQLKGK